MTVWESTPLRLYCIFVAALLGAAFGSFLNCAAWRRTHGESVWRGRSHCPACGHTLGAGELIPVLSWLILKGKCRHCGAKISARYPLTELLFAVLTVLCLLRFDLSWLCLRNWIFLCCLFYLTLTDLEAFLIPDGCLLTAAAAWLAGIPLMRPGWPTVRGELLAALLFGGGLLLLSLLMDRLLGRESLGGGDIKLLAVEGLYLGLAGSLFSLMLACLFGLLFGRLRRAGTGSGEAFPFGPSLAAAAAVLLFCGERLISWYLGLF